MLYRDTMYHHAKSVAMRIVEMRDNPFLLIVHVMQLHYLNTRGPNLCIP